MQTEGVQPLHAPDDMRGAWEGVRSGCCPSELQTGSRQSGQQRTSCH